jgi:uncharacterized protein (DUF983 family)
MSILEATKRGLRLRCPACGKGSLYQAFLTVDAKCKACTFPLKEHDAADGPAYVVMVFMSIFVITSALWLEFTYNPPAWLHVILWIPITLGGSLLLLRYVKSLFIAHQYHYNAEGFRQ